jgi:hypothetical protein
MIRGIYENPIAKIICNVENRIKDLCVRVLKNTEVFALTLLFYIVLICGVIKELRN